MADSSRNKAGTRGSTPKGAPGPDRGRATSVARSAVAVVLAVAGIVWMAVYLNVAQDGEQLTWMGDLGRWNFLIGFLLILAALVAAAHPSTPLGRGQGVVVGMLGSFLLGLVWIVVYYMANGSDAIPVVYHLDQYNLVVGIGFMAVGFVYATKWE